MHFSTFFNLEAKCAKKLLNKSKCEFSKFVSDFNFAPTKGSQFLISKKSQTDCTSELKYELNYKQNRRPHAFYVATVNLLNQHFYSYTV